MFVFVRVPSSCSFVADVFVALYLGLTKGAVSMKVTRRGQVTIPREIRRKTGIEENSEVEFAIDGGRIVITKKIGPNPFEGWAGALKRPQSSDRLVKKMRGHPS
ncbi:MAG: hypothetical protein A3G34_16365 [Candidatus Lindowbacteria bacterium RIFCSPLOWO2_12_FULL_62_27]|nr:MAG: hypothetical protein A3G34_16365 [Candidatus Lindowbacteria bacterium RIFCSPLOWO2_12_FULL_62_27]